MQTKLMQVLGLFACVVLLAGAVFADSCPTTTMDQYLGSGYTCSIGDKTFSNWSYTDTSNPGGYGIGASGVAVTPITTANNPGFQFSAGWAASTSSGILEQDSLIQYTVNVNQGGNLITDLSLSIAGAGFDGTGSIFVDETACLGAILPACTGGQIVTLSVYDYSGGSKFFDEISFPGVGEISLAKDITLQAGTNGDARLSLVTNQFSETVPEPGSMVLFGSGVVGLVGLLRRKLNF